MGMFFDTGQQAAAANGKTQAAFFQQGVAVIGQPSLLLKGDSSIGQS